MADDFPQWFLEKLKAIHAKRARTVIRHILKHGHITTEVLKGKYGYHTRPVLQETFESKGLPWKQFASKTKLAVASGLTNSPTHPRAEAESLPVENFYQKISSWKSSSVMAASVPRVQQPTTPVIYRLTIAYPMKCRAILRIRPPMNSWGYAGHATGRNRGHASIVRTGLRRKIRRHALHAIGPIQPSTRTLRRNRSAVLIWFGRQKR